jgi:spermidine/putrescine transport system ATP-binding protein
MPLLEIQEVVRRFGDFVAVDRVSIDIRAGEFFTLLGPSGCGKTTLLRLIAGFDLPDAGRILLNGEDLAGKPPEVRPVRTVFQSYALFPHMTVAGNVAFPLKMAGARAEEIQAKVAAALDGVRLTGFGNRMPNELSGGQKLREEMQLELIRLQKDVGITFVYVTHDQTEALALSHRIAVMTKGRVEQIDEPARLYGFPKTRFVADFIGHCNLFSGAVVDVGEKTMTVDVEGLGAVFVREGPVAHPGARVSLALRPEKVSIIKAQAGGGFENRFAGTVREMLYMGDVTVYRVQTGSGGVVEALLANSASGLTPFFQIGDAVEVGWSAAAGHVLAD